MQNQDPGDSLPGRKWIRWDLAFHGFDLRLSPAAYLLTQVRAELRIAERVQGSGRSREIERKHFWSRDREWSCRVVVNDVADEQLVVLAIDIRDEGANFGRPECHTEVSNPVPVSENRSLPVLPTVSRPRYNGFGPSRLPRSGISHKTSDSY